jgi:hypothetical protein
MGSKELRELAEKRSGIDVNDLICKIEDIKSQYKRNRRLTDFEEKYLCLILCQYPKEELAFIYDENRIPSREEVYRNKERLAKRSSILRSDASKGLNTYLKELIGLDEDIPLPQYKNGKLIKELKKVCKISNNIDNSDDEINIVITISKEKSKDMIDLLKKIISSIEFE